MSRKDRPKQLIRFIQRDGKGVGKEPTCLLSIAARRLEGLIPLAHRYICTAESYRELVREELPGYKDDQIIGEPEGRDTLNAIGLMAAILDKEDPEAIFAVLTADHIIEPDAIFKERMELGFRLVEDDPRRLVTFSIKPTYAATGFGYVERGAPIRGVEGSEKLAFHVARFVEKPDKPRAEAYFRSGEFSWNSGMFVWRASTFLEAIKKYKPESYEGLMQLKEAWGKRGFKGALEKIYPTLPRISVDYAVMEPAAKDAQKDDGKDAKRRLSVCTVQMDVKWLDVGSWPSYAETLDADKEGNRVAGQGPSVMASCKNTMVLNADKGHTVTVLGGVDLIVVHTKDATLIMPKARAEELKLLHAKVDDRLK